MFMVYQINLIILQHMILDYFHKNVYKIENFAKL